MSVEAPSAAVFQRAPTEQIGVNAVEEKGIRGRIKHVMGRAALVLSLAAGGFAATVATEAVSGRESVAQADALDRANGAEKAWCRVPSRLSLCLKAKELTGEAEVAAQNVSAEYGLAIHNGGADAFRHCYWSGLMTDEFGWQTAKGFGDRHEYKDGQDPREEAMDLYNNRQGRIWAQQVDNIGQRCLEGALQGELKGFVPHKW